MFGIKYYLYERNVCNCHYTNYIVYISWPVTFNTTLKIFLYLPKNFMCMKVGILWRPFSNFWSFNTMRLFPALNCVQNITMSSPLLCPANYCFCSYPKVCLFRFHMSACCRCIMMCLRSTSVLIKVRAVILCNK